MIYWKKVPAGDFKNYAPKVLKYFYEVNLPKKVITVKSHPFWNPVPFADIVTYFPELITATEIYGTIKHASVLLLTSDNCTIHIDGSTGINFGVKARLNIPLINTAGSITEFYTGLEGYPFYMTINGEKIWDNQFRYKLTPVTTVELIEPTILRTSEPHSVLAKNGKFPRIALTVIFKEDVVKYLEE